MFEGSQALLLEVIRRADAERTLEVSTDPRVMASRLIEGERLERCAKTMQHTESRDIRRVLEEVSFGLRRHPAAPDGYPW